MPLQNYLKKKKQPFSRLGLRHRASSFATQAKAGSPWKEQRRNADRVPGRLYIRVATSLRPQPRLLSPEKTAALPARFPCRGEQGPRGGVGSPHGVFGHSKGPQTPPPRKNRGGKRGTAAATKTALTPRQFEKRRGPQNRNNADDQAGSCSFPLVNRSVLRWAKERSQETSQGGKSLPNVSFVCRNCRG